MKSARIKLTDKGPDFSRLVLGFWRLTTWGMTTSDLIRFIEESLELGITTFDHADIYGSYTCEEAFGAALEKAPQLRDSMQLVTKCGIKLISDNRPNHTIMHYDTSVAHIIASAENSLKVLNTDRIDLLLIHRHDPLMDPDDVAEAFSKLRSAGKVLHFGVSNFTPSQLDLLTSRVNVPIVTNQVEFSVMHVEPMFDGTIDMCQKNCISPMAWSSLGGGSLFSGDDERAVRLKNALSVVGASLGDKPIDQVALAWLLNHPTGIVPVLGTGKLERVRSAVESEALELSREQWFAILAASRGIDVP
jgi:predicted oxidoreductase